MTAPCTPHVSSELKGFTRFHAPGDLMHTGDLGVVCWLFGAVFWELIYDGPLAGTIGHRLDQLFALIQSVYDELATTSRLGQLKRSMFERAGQFPCLSAKAAEARHLVPVMAIILERLDSGSDRDGHRHAAAKALCDMYEIFYAHGRCLPAGAADRAVACVNAFFEHNTWLMRHATDNARLLYHMVTKTHMLFHIADLSRWMNPRYIWCYSSEAFMKDVVSAARSSIASTPKHLLGSKVVQQSLLAIDLIIGEI